MNAARNKSEQDMSFIDIESKTEEDKSDEFDLVFKKDESCHFEHEKVPCKCVENFERKLCEKKDDDSVSLPSIVTDEEEIYFPNNIKKEDPCIYGKWLIFTNGDLRLQDHLWIQLQNLLKTGDLILLGSSTAKLCDNRGPFQGVIKCYTAKDIYIIRRAGLAIQNILNDQTILDYKTNEASQSNMYRAGGNRFITKFMLTVNGKFYKKDELCRWIQFTDTECVNFKFEESSSGNGLRCVFPSIERNHLHSESSPLPSLETRQKMTRYAYPQGSRLNNFSGIWCLFCNVADADNNGLTELDHAWNEAKVLRTEGFFTSIICETRAFQPHANEIGSRRSVMCELYDSGTNRIIECADKLRERLSYKIPMYYKIFMFNRVGKPEYKLKYLYTEDKELYEYINNKWNLLKRL